MIKRLLLFSVMAVSSAVGAIAGDYDYLIVQRNDGTQQAFTSSGLTITFSGANATFGTTTYSLSELDKMFFSATTTAIRDIQQCEDRFVEVYTTAGVHLGTYAGEVAMKASLPKGIYVVKGHGRTYKVTVK